MSDVFIGNLDYYLPKLSITKVEVLNGKGGIDLVIDYKFIENKEKAVSSRPQYDSYINKHIKPYIAAIPSAYMADIYEKHLRDPKPARPFLENMPNSLMLFSGLTEDMLQNSNIELAIKKGVRNTGGGSRRRRSGGVTFEWENTYKRDETLFIDNYNFFMNNHNYNLITANGKKSPALSFADNIEKSNVNEEGSLPISLKYTPLLNDENRVRQSIFMNTYANSNGIKTLISKDNINQTKLSVKVSNSENSGYTQLYLFAFAFLDIDSLLNDDTVIESGIKGSSGLDGLKEQLLSDANLDSLRNKRKYFHGKITRELILHGDFNFNKSDYNLKISDRTMLFYDSKDNFRPYLKTFSAMVDGSVRYFGVPANTHLSLVELRNSVQKTPYRNEIVPLFPKFIPNYKTIDNRLLSAINPNLSKRVNNFAESIAIYNDQTVPPSKTDEVMLAHRLFDRLRTVGVHNVESTIKSKTLREQQLVHEKKDKEGASFNAAMTITPEYGIGSCNIFIEFDQFDIWAKNTKIARLVPALTAKLLTTNERELPAEVKHTVHYLAGPRDAFRIREIKVLRKRVSNKFDEIDEFGCITGRSELIQQRQYDYFGVETLCTASELESRLIDIPEEGYLTLQKVNLENEQETESFKITNVKQSGGTIEEVIGPNWPRVRWMAFSDTSILDKREGVYQYGLEITYEEPLDKMIVMIVSQIKTLVDILDDIVRYFDIRRGSVFSTELTNLLTDKVESLLQESNDGEKRTTNDVVEALKGSIESFLENMKEYIDPADDTLGSIVSSISARVINRVYLFTETDDISDERYAKIRQSFFHLVNTGELESLRLLLGILKSAHQIMHRVSDYDINSLAPEALPGDTNTQRGFKTGGQKNLIKVITWLRSENPEDTYVDASQLRRPSMLSLNETYQMPGDGDLYGDSISLVTPEYMRGLLEKEYQKFDMASEAAGYSLRDAAGASPDNIVFSVTPNFHTLRDPDTSEIMHIPLFSHNVFQVMGQGAVDAINRSAQSATTYGGRIAEADRQRGLTTRGITTTQSATEAYLFMLGMFHALSSSDVSEADEGYNKILHHYDPTAIISALQQNSYFASQVVESLGQETQTGFSVDSPSTNSRNPNNNANQLINLESTHNNPIFARRVTTSQHYMRVDTILALTSRDPYAQVTMEHTAEKYERYFEGLMQVPAIRLAGPLVTATLTTKAAGLVTTATSRTNEGGTGARYNVNFPGAFASYDFRYKIERGGQGQRDRTLPVTSPTQIFLNPVIFDNSLLLFRVNSLGGYDIPVTVKEITDGIQPGYYYFHRATRFELGPSKLKPFRVIDSNNQASALRTRNNLYTYGGEFRYPFDHPTKPGVMYVGPFHIHPEAGYMEGAQHSRERHSTLVRFAGEQGSKFRPPSRKGEGIPATSPGGQPSVSRMSQTGPVGGGGGVGGPNGGGSRGGGGY